MSEIIRRSVDLDEEVVKILDLGAVSKKVSTKRYMEQILHEAAARIKNLNVGELVKKELDTPKS